MQHYHTPTRILDWTENMLIALYFAVEEDQNENVASKLFVLNAKRLNKHTSLAYKNRPYAHLHAPDDFETIVRCEMARSTHKMMIFRSRAFSQSYFDFSDEIDNLKTNIEKYATPIAIFPNRLNNRMLLQSSVFTVHGGKCYNVFESGKGDPFPTPVNLEDINATSTNKFLKYFVIPSKAKAEIREELFALGIHKGSLFPELDFQSASLRRLWSPKTNHDTRR